MKKPIIFLFCIAISLHILPKDAVTLPVDEKGNVVFSEVVEIQDVAKDILFIRGMEWLAKTYRSSKDVIQMEDKEAGKIIGKGLTIVYVKVLGMKFDAGPMRYTIAMYFKDGKFKYEFSNFYHEGNRLEKIGAGGAIENEKPACGNPFTGGGMTKGRWNGIKSQTDITIREIIADMKEFMAKGATSSDNW